MEPVAYTPPQDRTDHQDTLQHHLLGDASIKVPVPLDFDLDLGTLSIDDDLSTLPLRLSFQEDKRPVERTSYADDTRQDHPHPPPPTSPPQHHHLQQQQHRPHPHPHQSRTSIDSTHHHYRPPPPRPQFRATPGRPHHHLPQSPPQPAHRPPFHPLHAQPHHTHHTQHYPDPHHPLYRPHAAGYPHDQGRPFRPSGPVFRPQQQQQQPQYYHQERPIGANLQSSPSMRGPPLPRPRPPVVWSGGAPYNRPPHRNDSISSQGSDRGGARVAGIAGMAGSTSPPRKRPLSVQYLDEMRQRAKDSGEPFCQFEYAKALIEAAMTFGNDDPDQKRQKKNKEALFMEGLKIIKRLATTNIGIGRPAYSEAQFFLGNCYGSGSLGLQIDHDKAFNFYLQASKQNHPAATYRTGVCHELAAGTKRDYGKAMQFYRKAAALSDTAAMYKLGMILLKGLLGQPANPREAITWLKRAAAQANEHHPHAVHELASCHERAGIPTIISDESYARKLYTQAAELGYAPSQYRLGHGYEYGVLTCPMDPRTSIAWYTRAAEQGDADSELGLSGWYLTGAEGVLKQSDTEAYLWARKAADKGLDKAEYAVGYYSEAGIGVKQDVEEARRWYLRAAAQGYGRAKKRLTDMKKQGAMRRILHERNRQGPGPEDENCKVM